jgi:hypothetical protein
MAVGDPRPASIWRAAILVSVLLWLAVLAGNIVLYVVRPAGHWPALETIEAVQSASLIPVAIFLHRRNRGSWWSGPVTTLGVGAMLAGTAVAIGFATGAVAFGEGAIGGPGFFAGFILLLIWLVAANLLAWRLGSLPRRLAVIGMAAGLTAMLLYPLWAVGLARTLDAPGEMERRG